MNIERYNCILHNEAYKKYLRKNEKCEKERKYCHHDLQHFLDVARIAYIINLEGQFGFEKDIIYGAALLHDIGRWKQYKYGIPHEKASAELAEEILKECNYDPSEIQQILSAIINHRSDGKTAGGLEDILYQSDKMSRNCFKCGAFDKCNWSLEQKNVKIKY